MGALPKRLFYGCICLQLLLAVTSVILAAICASVDGERTNVISYYFTGFVLAFVHVMHAIVKLNTYTCKLKTVLNKKFLKLLRSRVVRYSSNILLVIWNFIGLYMLFFIAIVIDDTSYIKLNAKMARGLLGCHMISMIIMFFSTVTIIKYLKESKNANIQSGSYNPIETENPAQSPREQTGNLTGQTACTSYNDARTEFSPLAVIDVNRLHAIHDELKHRDIMTKQSDDGDRAPFVISVNTERPPPPAYYEVMSVNLETNN